MMRWLRSGSIGFFTLIVLGLLSGFGTVASAAAPLKFQRYGLESGLSQSVVNRIVQDRQGFLWFATQDGLNRFDGYRFRVFRNASDDPDSLSANFISALYLDRQGVLWVGTEVGLDRYEPSAGRFEHIALDDKTIRVNAILDDAQGTLWLGTNNGLFKRAADGRLQRFGFDPARADSLSDNRINALADDGMGGLWIGTEDGLNRFDPKTGLNTRYLHQASDPNSLSDNRVLALYRTPSGEFWVGTRNGLNRYRLGAESFRRYFASDSPHSLSDNRIQALIADSEGRLWVGTENGISRYRREHDDFDVFRTHPGDSNSLSGDDITSFALDRAGLLWVGTYGGGLSVWNPATERFAHYLSGYDQVSSLGHNQIESLLVDRLGRIWAGTGHSGIYRLDRAADRVERFQHEPSRPDSLAADHVPALLEDRLGRIWVGTHGGGLDRYQPETGGFRHYRHDDNEPASIDDDRILSLHETRDGEIWIGTESGLQRFREATDNFEDATGTLPPAFRNIDSRVSVILDDSEGGLWVGGEGGLLLRRPGQSTFQLFQADPAQPGSLSHSTVLSLYESSVGTLWIGTAAGLNRAIVSGDSVRFESVTEREGLPNGVVYGILGDGVGRLWLSTNQGLVRYDPINHRFERYTARDGLQSNEFYAMSRAMAADGELFFGGINGFNGFYPEHILANHHRPGVLFSSLREYRGEGNRERDLAGLNDVTIPTGTRMFSIDFAADDFSDPGLNRFQYRLLGFNDDWVQLDNRHELSFSDLPAGDYRLELRAANNSGLWSESAATMRLRVASPWWARPWSLILEIPLALGILGLAAGFGWRRRQAAKRRALERAQAEQERYRALEQSHHSLANHLDQLERTLQERNDENQALTQQLYELSLLDGLTEIHNRRQVMLQAARLWAGEMRRGHALLLVNIDGFSRFNRHEGYGAGDRLLTQVATVLKGLCPENAMLARWGGDEFLILLPGAGVEASERLAEQIRVSIATHLFELPGDKRVHLSASIGACCHAFLLGTPQAGFEQSLYLAESALRAAKMSSRNAWVLIGPGAETPSREITGDDEPQALFADAMIRISSSLPRGQILNW